MEVMANWQKGFKRNEVLHKTCEAFCKGCLLFFVNWI